MLKVASRVVNQALRAAAPREACVKELIREMPVFRVEDRAASMKAMPAQRAKDKMPRREVMLKLEAPSAAHREADKQVAVDSKLVAADNRRGLAQATTLMRSSPGYV